MRIRATKTLKASPLNNRVDAFSVLLVVFADNH